MRTAVTFVRSRGAEKADLLFGLETPIDEQLRAVKDLIGNGKENSEYEFVEFWSSDSGRMKRFEFRPPTAPGNPPASPENLSAEEQAEQNEENVPAEIEQEKEQAAGEEALKKQAEQEKKKPSRSRRRGRNRS